VIDIFLPMRAGSERIKNKNTREFACYKLGLFEIKLNQLLKVKSASKIVISTDDDIILKYLRYHRFSKVKIHEREPFLCTSDTSTDDLIPHAAEICDSHHIFWTHVTSPFFDDIYMEDAISQYFKVLKLGHDSLMSVDKCQEFLIDSSSCPINFDRSREKWPRTQTLKPIYRINSAAFITSKELYMNKQDRIGEKPYLLKLEHNIALDIDWPLDFEIAEYLFQKGNKMLK
jgi:CMP-N-acetylneuraminic acid synthetase